jgi:hypothetical protein
LQEQLQQNMPVLSRLNSTTLSSSLPHQLGPPENQSLRELLFNVTALLLAAGSLVVAFLHYLHQRTEREGKHTGGFGLMVILASFADFQPEQVSETPETARSDRLELEVVPPIDQTPYMVSTGGNEEKETLSG